MKQSAAKTLGVAALGAAFAAVAAGTASAAHVVPDATGALGDVSQTLPVQEVTGKLPAGAADALAGGGSVVTDGASTLPGAVQGAVGEVAPSGATEQVAGLLGGLPVAGGGLPTDALTGGGLPVAGGLLPALGV
ncbi:ATP-binding protein [Streptomyces sp. NPDC096176]|uniref:ATP-binding protein n=1 Tax=Streptomyces sp. NPDC096176 TaxID=3366079 RepID=UPI00382FB487